jgi:hypothetical protein
MTIFGFENAHFQMSISLYSEGRFAITLTIVKLEFSTFRLYANYIYYRPIFGPEVVLEIDHVKK